RMSAVARSFFFFQAEDGIRDFHVTGVQTCALPISWDTTCARVGCMPSKLLISSANRMYDIQSAEKLALKHNAVIDTSDVMQRVHVLRERFIRATLKGVDQWDSSHKISGKAKFIDSQTIEVNGQSYRAKSFIVAVGSRPN